MSGRRHGRVAEGGGLLNRYRGKTPIEGSNPSVSASSLLIQALSEADFGAWPLHRVRGEGEVDWKN